MVGKLDVLWTLLLLFTFLLLFLGSQPATVAGKGDRGNRGTVLEPEDEDTKRLAKRLKKYKDQLFTFVRSPPL